MKGRPVKLPGEIEIVELVRREAVENSEPNPYLTLWNLGVRNRYADGRQSAVYRYEAVLRKYLDAVVLVLTATCRSVSWSLVDPMT